MADCRLLLFGPPQIQRDDHIVRIRLRKAIALVAYLGVERRGFSREYLAALLWPDLREKNALHNLRQTLSVLRKTFSEGCIDTDGDQVVLDRGLVKLDVDEFHSLIGGELPDTGVGRLEAASKLHRGRFLEGFNLGSCQEFDEWQDAVRERLQLELDELLEELSSRYLEMGQPKNALPHAQRWLQLDQWNEAAHRTLMEILSRCGRAGAALKQFRACSRTLAKEGLEPDELTCEVRDAIAANHVPPDEAAELAIGRRSDRATLFLSASNVSERPVELLQHLIRFDTTNPPGNEEQCIGFVELLLTQAGIETTLLAKTRGRPNLIARLPGEGHAPPLLLYGHVDVVTTANQSWTHPPFEANIANGCVWGRGALDMKGGIAMMLTALLRAKERNLRPAGDIVLVLLSDEEAGGENGAQFLVEQHPAVFTGVHHAIGEFGGSPIYDGVNKYYAIQVAEKGVCWLKATIRGAGGHGSLPVRGGTMARLSHLLRVLDENHLAVRATAPVREMIRVMAKASPLLAGLLEPTHTDAVLDGLGPAGVLFDAMLHNTVNATVVHGGLKTNVIPSEISLELDGRIVPGSSCDELVEELRGLVGDDVEFEPLQDEPTPGDADMELFPMLEEILREADPGASTVPMLLPGATDGRHLARLGIQTYGFLPMNLPPDVDFSRTIHGADERIPVTALEFGTDAIYNVLERYGR